MCNKPKENFGASIGSVIQEHVCLEEKVVGIQIQVEELITLKIKKKKKKWKRLYYSFSPLL